VVDSGGPAGPGDAYLHVTSNGADFGPGSKLAMFNEDSRWTGNYLSLDPSELVTGLEVDLNNLGQVPLTMWFMLEQSGDRAFTSSFELQPNSGWQHAAFSLKPEDLLSHDEIELVLEDVTKLWLVNLSQPSQGGPPSFPGRPVVAELGVDNLMAIGAPVEPLPGDYNGNGRVEQADLDLVLLNWGRAFDELPAEWINERPTQGGVDQAELDGVLLNWGNAVPEGIAAVPEPAGWMLSAVAIIPMLATARRQVTRKCAPARSS
jgi:hypothetical protein